MRGVKIIPMICNAKDGDTVRIKLNGNKASKHIEVIGEVVSIGIDADRNILEISILDASHHVPEPNKFEYVDIPGSLNRTKQMLGNI